MIRISEKEINPDELIKVVANSETGAVVTFTGIVRGRNNGKKVLHLKYEAHKQMAEKLLKQLKKRIKKQYSVSGIAIQLRIGTIKAGEISVLIAVSAPHRKEAFEACHHIIDSIKHTLPVWKKEYYEDGSQWVNGTVVNSAML